MTPEEQDEPSFFQRYRVAIIIAAVVVIGAAAFLLSGRKDGAPKRSAPTVVNIMPVLPPPPPPPPPQPTPPPPEPPPEQQKQPEFQPEQQPDSPKDPPPPEAPPALGTNIQGDGGADGFGLSGNGKGGLIGGGGKGGGGSKWGWYAGQVQTRVVQALQSNKRTRSASLNIQVRVWADSTGRITKAVLAGSSGDAAVDKAIQSEVLSGLQLSEAPPADMPMPIVMRIKATRPN